MNDRELLEKAAKAAGIICLGKLGWSHPDGEIRAWWNPLTDDGDALRLAVKLELLRNNAWMRLLNTFDYGIDPLAATRRAIVRAAAAIGESM